MLILYLFVYYSAFEQLFLLVWWFCFLGLIFEKDFCLGSSESQRNERKEEMRKGDGDG